jgi:hypothetical protein
LIATLKPQAHKRKAQRGQRKPTHFGKDGSRVIRERKENAMFVGGLENRVKQALESKEATRFFVDRQGNIEDVSADVDSIELAMNALDNEARALGNGPYFTICDVVNGKVWCDDAQPTLDNLPESLKEALDTAQDVRLQFYVERVKEFGMSALPDNPGEKLLEAAREALKATAAKA